MRLTAAQTPTNDLAGAFGVKGIAHETGTDKGTIRLYSSWPSRPANQQQRSSTVGVAMTEAVNLALEIYGSAAGGYRLIYTPLNPDTDEYPGVWDAEREMANAVQAITDATCMAYLGTFSSRAAEVSLSLLNTGEPPVPVISGANTAPGLNRAIPGVTRAWEPHRYYPSGIRNYLRVAPTDDAQARAAARWISGQGKRRAAVLHDDTDYGSGLAAIFADTLVALGGEAPVFAQWVADAQTYLGLARDVAAAAPDHVYLAGIETEYVATLIRDLRAALGADVTLLLADGLMSEQLVAFTGAEAIEGAIATSFEVPSESFQGPAAIWADTLRERLTDYEPDVWCIGAFESAVAVIQAIDAVGDADRAAILDVLRGITGFRGITGTWDFDANGERSVVPISFHTATNGRFVIREVVQAPSAATAT